VKIEHSGSKNVKFSWVSNTWNTHSKRTFTPLLFLSC
jgi:hypothetical protein